MNEVQVSLEGILKEDILLTAEYIGDILVDYEQGLYDIHAFKIFNIYIDEINHPRVIDFQTLKANNQNRIICSVISELERWDELDRVEEVL